MPDRNATAEAGALFVAIKEFVKADFDPRLKMMWKHVNFVSNEVTALRKIVSQQDQTIREQKKEIQILKIKFDLVNRRTLGKSDKPVKLLSPR